MNNEEEMGYIGEKLVCQLLNGIQSTNKYDKEKDITLTDGTKVEVKTQVRYKKYNAFTINTRYSNQLKKCSEVDRLIFVEYGTSGYIRMYECIDRNYEVKPAGNRTMAVFPINKMIKIFDRYIPDVNEKLVKLSNSEPKWINDSHMYN